MPALLPDVDPDGLLEYSVVYTDRALNHMSDSFQQVMKDISGILKDVYHADAAIVVPGSGTFGMEAVARQFATARHCLVIRNGWFSYRWTQIFEMGNIPRGHKVFKASQVEDAPQAPFQPAAIEAVVEYIQAEKPAMVFAPHVETSSGMMLPNDYIVSLATAVHDAGGMLVLDCIASGTLWVDMQALGVDILISAPQKGWSGPPCCGLVMLSQRARQTMDETESSSFAMDLKKWHQIMLAYEGGAHAYHATMPTDSLRQFRDVMLEAKAFGFDELKRRQQELGDRVRALLRARGVISVAADGFDAPGVVVAYTEDADIQSGARFAAEGMQIAAGVPLQCDERDDFRSFRLGLFGLDKLKDVGQTVSRLENVLDEVL